MPLVTSANLTNIFKGFRVIFDTAYQAATPDWTDLAMRVASTGSEEEYDWLGAVPGMRELLGEVVLKNLTAHQFTIRNREWEDTIKVKRKDIERDKLGIYSPMVKAMADAAAQHPDDLVASLLCNGFTDKDYTGSAFFALNKEPVKGGTKFSNKGTKQFSQANFREARTNLRTRKNSAGRSLKLGRDLLLVVSPKFESQAREVLFADKLNNNTNVDKGTARLKVFPDLTTYNEDAWFLLEVGNAIKPLIVQFELDPTPQSVTNLNDSYVVLNQAFLYQLYGRYAAGYGLSEFAWGSDGSVAA